VGGLQVLQRLKNVRGTVRPQRVPARSMIAISLSVAGAGLLRGSGTGGYGMGWWGSCGREQFHLFQSPNVYQKKL